MSIDFREFIENKSKDYKNTAFKTKAVFTISEFFILSQNILISSRII